MQIDKFEVRAFPNLSGFQAPEGAPSLKVCIATEEVLGPVRNGGIASTYTHLAVGLAAEGHDVTIILLKGRKVQEKDPEYWINYYADKGVTLEYLDWVDEPFEHMSHPWQGRCLALYRWLKQRSFDLVHTSEWRGGAYYALAAKRLGLAFEQTLFIVKASSPYIWNRHYQMLPMEWHTLFSVAHLEQKCIEWADMVIGGSAHLLSFMADSGYCLPKGRVYNHPNIVDFTNLTVVERRRKLSPGERVFSNKLAFFGRLETRKGLENFCNALNILVNRGCEIEKVIFVGKPGLLLREEEQTGPLEYITDFAERWPFTIELFTDLGQSDALSLLCSDDYIAVMPSLIENSTMTVYEALALSIPFIATAVGGTPELIDPQDRAEVLVAPTIMSLADRLESVLSNGLVIPKAAFNNDQNTEQWYAFHRYLGVSVQRENDSNKTAQSELFSVPRFAEQYNSQITLVIAVTAEGELEKVNFKNIPSVNRLVICLFINVKPEESFPNAPEHVVFHHSYGLPLGVGLDAAIKQYVKDAFIVTSVPDLIFHPEFSKYFQAALANRPSDLITCFYRYGRDDPLFKGRLVTPIGGDLAHQAINDRVFGLEFIALTLETYRDSGGFCEVDLSYGIIHEFVARLLSRTHIDLFVIPEALLGIARDYNPAVSNQKTYKYLKLRPFLEDLPLYARKLFMFAASSEGSKYLLEVDVYDQEKKGIKR